MIAACDLLTHIGAVIVDCAVMVELKALGGSAKLQAKYPGVTVRESSMQKLSWFRFGAC
jgi:hypothetical protein